MKRPGVWGWLAEKVVFLLETIRILSEKWVVQQEKEVVPQSFFFFFLKEREAISYRA